MMMNKLSGKKRGHPKKEALENWPTSHEISILWLLPGDKITVCISIFSQYNLLILFFIVNFKVLYRKPVLNIFLERYTQKSYTHKIASKKILHKITESSYGSSNKEFLSKFFLSALTIYIKQPLNDE